MIDTAGLLPSSSFFAVLLLLSRSTTNRSLLCVVVALIPTTTSEGLTEATTTETGEYRLFSDGATVSSFLYTLIYTM